MSHKFSYPLYIFKLIFYTDIEEKGVRMKLTVIDTPGFGDQINNENWSVSTWYKKRFLWLPVFLLYLMCFLVSPCLFICLAGSPSWSSLMHSMNSIYRKRLTLIGRRRFQIHESTAAYILFLLQDTGETHTHIYTHTVLFQVSHKQ